MVLQMFLEGGPIRFKKKEAELIISTINFRYMVVMVSLDSISEF